MLNFVFLTTSLSTASLNFFKYKGTIHLPTSKLSAFAFKLSKEVGALTNLLMSSLSTSTFKAVKSFLAAKSDAPAPIACSNFF